MAARPIDFYFDFSSPYAYIASEWIEALAARHGRTVSWRAMLLGATFLATELKANVSYPLKREYVMVDFERSARFAGVPLTLPQTFPISTQNAARVFWWLNDSDEARARQWARHCLRAYFTRGVDLSDNQALAGLGSEFGLEDGQTEAVASNSAWKARLKEVNDAAIAAGVFGVPFFVVDGEPFWGNDRLDQVDAWLATGGF
jgi:2-hydroxychromene-2-carboxylate isomerase